MSLNELTFGLNRSSTVGKGRMEAFSDGVLAIIITIMVLELRVPLGADPAALIPLIPVFLSYRAQFHLSRHLLEQPPPSAPGCQTCRRPCPLGEPSSFVLALLDAVRYRLDGREPFASWPVALYGVVLLFSAIAYFILARALIALHGTDSVLATALGHDFKGKISVVLYAAAIPLAFVNSWSACAVYVLVAIMWLVPDKRIEKTLVQ